MSTTEDQNFKTGHASALLKSRGLAASTSYLEKCRGRGADDTRDRGPDFFRDESGVCWYPRSSLEQYAARRLAARQFREPAPQPAQLRRRTSAA